MDTTEERDWCIYLYCIKFSVIRTVLSDAPDYTRDYHGVTGDEEKHVENYNRFFDM
jgi:hypothetical protein